MEELQVTNKNVVEQLAQKIAIWATEGTKRDRMDYLKLKLGLETLFINISKSVLIYTIAIFLDLFLATLVFHLCYCFIRRSSHGIHASSSIMCSIMSVICFVGIPYVCTYIEFSPLGILLLFGLNMIILYYFAPKSTVKNVISNPLKRKKLRNQSIVSCLILMIVALLMSNEIAKSLIAIGTTLACLLVLPIPQFKKERVQ